LVFSSWFFIYRLRIRLYNLLHLFVDEAFLFPQSSKKLAGNMSCAYEEEWVKTSD